MANDYDYTDNTYVGGGGSSFDGGSYNYSSANITPVDYSAVQFNFDTPNFAPVSSVSSSMDFPVSNSVPETSWWTQAGQNLGNWWDQTTQDAGNWLNDNNINLTSGVGDFAGINPETGYVAPTENLYVPESYSSSVLSSNISTPSESGWDWKDWNTWNPDNAVHSINDISQDWSGVSVSSSNNQIESVSPIAKSMWFEPTGDGNFTTPWNVTGEDKKWIDTLPGGVPEPTSDFLFGALAASGAIAPSRLDGSFFSDSANAYNPNKIEMPYAKAAGTDAKDAEGFKIDDKGNRVMDVKGLSDVQDGANIIYMKSNGISPEDFANIVYSDGILKMKNDSGTVPLDDKAQKTIKNVIALGGGEKTAETKILIGSLLAYNSNSNNGAVKVASQIIDKAPDVASVNAALAKATAGGKTDLSVALTALTGSAPVDTGGSAVPVGNVNYEDLLAQNTVSSFLKDAQKVDKATLPMQMAAIGAGMAGMEFRETDLTPMLVEVANNVNAQKQLLGTNYREGADALNYQRTFDRAKEIASMALLGAVQEAWVTAPSSIAGLSLAQANPSAVYTMDANGNQVLSKNVPQVVDEFGHGTTAGQMLVSLYFPGLTPDAVSAATGQSYGRKGSLEMEANIMGESAKANGAKAFEDKNFVASAKAMNDEVLSYGVWSFDNHVNFVNEKGQRDAVKLEGPENPGESIVYHNLLNSADPSNLTTTNSGIVMGAGMLLAKNPINETYIGSAANRGLWESMGVWRGEGKIVIVDGGGYKTPEVMRDYNRKFDPVYYNNSAVGGWVPILNDGWSTPVGGDSNAKNVVSGLGAKGMDGAASGQSTRYLGAEGMTGTRDTGPAVLLEGGVNERQLYRSGLKPEFSNSTDIWSGNVKTTFGMGTLEDRTGYAKLNANKVVVAPISYDQMEINRAKSLIAPSPVVPPSGSGGTTPPVVPVTPPKDTQPTIITPPVPSDGTPLIPSKKSEFSIKVNQDNPIVKGASAFFGNPIVQGAVPIVGPVWASATITDNLMTDYGGYDRLQSFVDRHPTVSKTIKYGMEYGNDVLKGPVWGPPAFAGDVANDLGIEVRVSTPNVRVNPAVVDFVKDKIVPSVTFFLDSAAGKHPTLNGGKKDVQEKPENYSSPISMIPMSDLNYGEGTTTSASPSFAFSSSNDDGLDSSVNYIAGKGNVSSSATLFAPPPSVDWGKLSSWLETFTDNQTTKSDNKTPNVKPITTNDYGGEIIGTLSPSVPVPSVSSQYVFPKNIVGNDPYHGKSWSDLVKQYNEEKKPNPNFKQKCTNGSCKHVRKIETKIKNRKNISC